MLETNIVLVDELSLLGVKIDLPNAPVLMIVGKKGFIGCGYFNIEVADKVAQALAIVSGVSSFDDVLAATIKDVSSTAVELGVTIGMTGANAARLLA